MPAMAGLPERPIQAFAITSIIIVFTYLCHALYYRRFKKNSHLPQLPTSFLWGHLKVFNNFAKQGVVDRHPGEFPSHSQGVNSLSADIRST